MVVFGYSDDNTEFRGVINDEIWCYERKDIRLNLRGPLESNHECECKYCGYEQAKKGCRKIVAIFQRGPWRWETDIPHATFEIKEDGDIYCVGIVFDASELDHKP